MNIKLPYYLSCVFFAVGTYFGELSMGHTLPFGPFFVIGGFLLMHALIAAFDSIG